MSCKEACGNPIGVDRGVAPARLGEPCCCSSCSSEDLREVSEDSRFGTGLIGTLLDVPGMPGASLTREAVAPQPWQFFPVGSPANAGRGIASATTKHSSLTNWGSFPTGAANLGSASHLSLAESAAPLTETSSLLGWDWAYGSLSVGLWEECTRVRTRPTAIRDGITGLLGGSATLRGGLVAVDDGTSAVERLWDILSSRRAASLARFQATGSWRT